MSVKSGIYIPFFNSFSIILVALASLRYKHTEHKQQFQQPMLINGDA